jgi:PBP1b-binding outer membrane lipoprotein LpoB
MKAMKKINIALASGLLLTAAMLLQACNSSAPYETQSKAGTTTAQTSAPQVKLPRARRTPDMETARTKRVRRLTRTPDTRTAHRGASRVSRRAIWS